MEKKRGILSSREKEKNPTSFKREGRTGNNVGKSLGLFSMALFVVRPHF